MAEVTQRDADRAAAAEATARENLERTFCLVDRPHDGRAFDFLVYEARTAFDNLLRRDIVVPDLREISYGFRHDDFAIEFRARFRDRSEDWFWRISGGPSMPSLRACLREIGPNPFVSLYRGMANRWRERARLEQLATQPPAYYSLGVDLAGPDDQTVTINLRPGAVNFAAEVQQLSAAGWDIAREFREAQARLIDEAFGVRQRYFREDFFRDDRSEAQARGEKLLREWLSPAQLRDLEAKGAFDVTGGSSGRRYRIRRGTVQNVFELDDGGREMCGWCFAPAGHLVSGDVMLAQKVALETDERGALAVANPFFLTIGPGLVAP